MVTHVPLTSSNLLAAASDILASGGYQLVDPPRVERWPITSARLLEDSYGVVAVVVYETWADLATGWPTAQGALVELMSAYLTSAEPKAWEGYLVLLTPSVLPHASRLEAMNIRHDVTRVRKLLATGDELSTLADLERVLLPLLPLNIESTLEEQESVLDVLPTLLARRGLAEDAMALLIDSFRRNEPLIERLHTHRSHE
jgi:hypothetical protein